ncbi:MerR family transcriptional regulator [Vibrio hannami]|uniref:MerR family transcriptional regulator n=1 Tax=Vibrio hannami TaxID=2717094 RepID=UPI00240F12E0|nr:MerR family transcriptional regulator [Vibrio hannami]MDG3086134.1 MerR family transcriptional regulator [Vibrio hannami]
MKLYAIREVSEITGIKPVTLRAWQRRYGLIQPERTESGHRLYTEANIEKIKLIQSWLVKGVSIGKIKGLIDSDTDINDESDVEMLSEVDGLMSALATLNKSKAESLITMVMKEYPLDIVKAQFFYPVLERIERVKASQRSLQKALLQSLMISKATSIIEAENRAFKKGKALMVNLDNVGSLPAWFSALELSDNGYNITFLDGVDELSGLAEIVNKSKLDLVYIYSNRGLPAKLAEGVRLLEEQLTVELQVSELIQKMRFA